MIELETMAAPAVVPVPGLRVTCVQEHLARALATVSRAVGTRTHMPILGHVLLVTDGERLRVTATNLAESITTWVPARVLGEGRATAPAALLSEVVRALPSGRDVAVEATGTSVRVQCERVVAHVKGDNAHEFPPVALLDDAGVLARVPAREFRDAVGQVAFAAAKDEARPVLSGVNLRLAPGGTRLEAADGFRLAIREVAGVAVEEEAGLVVPARAIADVARLVAPRDEGDVVEVRATANRTLAGFRVPAPGGDVVVTTRLLEGTFPDLARIVPATPATVATVDRAELARAVAVALLFARDSADTVRLEVAPGSLDVSATSKESGDNRSVVACDATGEGQVVHLSGAFLAEWLGSVKAGRVELGVSGPLSPVACRGVGDAGHVHVVMPMHAAGARG